MFAMTFGTAMLWLCQCPPAVASIPETKREATCQDAVIQKRTCTPALVSLLARDLRRGIRAKVIRRLMEALKSRQEACGCAN